MKYRFYIILLFLFSVLLLTGCLFPVNNQKQNTAAQTINSEDSLFSVTVPKGWVEVTDHSLNDQAELQAKRLYGNQYFVAIIENKNDLENYTFDEWLTKARDRYLATFESCTIITDKDVIIDGQPAKQYEINMIKDRVKITMLATYINGKNYFAQILAWTITSKYKSSFEELNAITNSIKGL